MPATRPDDGGTLKYSTERPPPNRKSSSAPALLDPRARDVDVSSSSFRNLLIGGGFSGLGTILCAADISQRGGGLWTWFWQLAFAVVFLWFVTASRGILSGRGFLVDRSGLYMRTRGEVFGVSWDEISAAGVSTQPWIHQRRLAHPGRRCAFEFFPADRGFSARHPELERWLIDDRPPRPGLPTTRYRFFLPPLSRIPKQLEESVRTMAPRVWVGKYRRE
jgi:hypothetical protein